MVIDKAYCITNHVFAQGGFTLPGAPCTLGIFAAISSQCRWDKKKLLGPHLNAAPPGTAPFGKSVRVYCITFIKRLDKCLRLQFLRQNSSILQDDTLKFVGKILNWGGSGSLVIHSNITANYSWTEWTRALLYGEMLKETEETVDFVLIIEGILI